MVAGGNRNANNYPIGADGKRDWSFGLFDCFNSCGTCTCHHQPFHILTDSLFNRRLSEHLVPLCGL